MGKKRSVGSQRKRVGGGKIWEKGSRKERNRQRREDLCDGEVSSKKQKKTWCKGRGKKGDRGALREAIKEKKADCGGNPLLFHAILRQSDPMGGDVLKRKGA